MNEKYKIQFSSLRNKIRNAITNKIKENTRNLITCSLSFIYKFETKHSIVVLFCIFKYIEFSIITKFFI